MVTARTETDASDFTTKSAEPEEWYGEFLPGWDELVDEMERWHFQQKDVSPPPNTPARSQRGRSAALWTMTAVAASIAICSVSWIYPHH